MGTTRGVGNSSLLNFHRVPTCKVLSGLLCRITIHSCQIYKKFIRMKLFMTMTDWSFSSVD